jgi:gephyrin
MFRSRRRQVLMVMLSEVSSHMRQYFIGLPYERAGFVATDSPGVYKVVTAQTHALSTPLPKGSIYRINTGAPLPRGADTVIMVEDTRLVSTRKDTDGQDGEENEVETLAQIPVGENVRDLGSDVKAGELVLQKGEVITSLGGEIGTLAFVGRKEVGIMASCDSHC